MGHAIRASIRDFPQSALSFSLIVHGQPAPFNYSGRCQENGRCAAGDCLAASGGDQEGVCSESEGLPGAKTEPAGSGCRRRAPGHFFKETQAMRRLWMLLIALTLLGLGAQAADACWGCRGSGYGCGYSGGCGCSSCGCSSCGYYGGCGCSTCGYGGCSSCGYSGCSSCGYSPAYTTYYYAPVYSGCSSCGTTYTTGYWGWGGCSSCGW